MLKVIADALAAVLVLPPVLLYRLEALLIGSERAFPGWSQALSLLPGLVGVYLRRAFYHRVLPRCGEGACLSFGTILSSPKARIGRDVYVGSFCVVGDATLEDDVLLASHVSIINGGHQHGVERVDTPIQEQQGRYPHVTIGRGTWIGERAVVMVDVGEQCVIGAGSVVTRPIPDRAVAVGAPARVIRFREPDELSNNRPSERNRKDQTPVAAPVTKT